MPVIKDWSGPVADAVEALAALRQKARVIKKDIISKWKPDPSASDQ